MSEVFDKEYPIQPQQVKAVYKNLRGPADRKEPWIYLQSPKSELFDVAEPVSELMVVFLAGLIIPLLGWRTLVVREEFPDALVVERVTGKQLRVEFEALTSNFVRHGHPPSGCDYIMCWRDDMTEAEKARCLHSQNPDLRIIELRRLLHHYDFIVEPQSSNWD